MRTTAATPESTPANPSTETKEPVPRAFSGKAYSYIRMSTKEQLQGDSLRRQLQQTRAYAKKHNLELVEDYDDIGVSAFRGRNAEQGALRRFLDAVQTGEIPQGSHLVIESMDRLTRQTAMTAVALMSEIIDAGITIVTLDNQVSYSAESVATNQANLFIAIGEIMRAHEESRRKSNLLSHAWSEKRKQLRESGTIITARVPAWLSVNKSTGEIRPIPERAAVVREVFDLACSGYGTYSIAKTLNQRNEQAWGTPKKSNARPLARNSLAPHWHESYVKKILANRAVLGEFQPRTVQTLSGGKKLRKPEGEPIPDYYPRIISDDIFRDAALAMERRRTTARGRKGPVYANILSGLLFCDRCGAGMRFIDKGPGPKGGQYLRCSRTVAGGDCCNKAYKYESVEQTVLLFLENLDIKKLLGEVPVHQRLSDGRHKLALLEVDLFATEKKIANTVEAISVGGTSPSLESHLRALEREADRIGKEIKRLEAEVEEATQYDPTMRQAVLTSLLAQIGKDADLEFRVKARRALADELRRLISHMTIANDTQFAHEIIEVDPSWQKTYRTNTQSRLEKYLETFGFEISVQYRNGTQQIISGIKQEHFKMKWNRKLVNFRLLAEHELQ